MPARQPAAARQEPIATVGVVLHLSEIQHDATLSINLAGEKKIDPDAFERLLPFESLANEPQHRHGSFSPFDLEFALIGQPDVSDVVIHELLLIKHEA